MDPVEGGIVIGGVVISLADVAVILGVGAVLIAANAAKWAFVGPFVGLLRGVPVIGGQLADIVSTGWDSVVAGLQRNLDDAVAGLTAMLDLLHGAYQLVLDGLTGTAESLGYQVGQALGGLGDLGDWAGAQLGHLLDLAKAAAHDAVEGLQTAQHALQKVQALIQGGIQDLIDASLHDFQATVNDLVKVALVPVHASIHAVHSLAVDFHRMEVATREHEVAQLGQAIDGAKAQLNTRIHGVEGDVKDLRIEGRSIEGEIGSILDTIGPIAAGVTLTGLLTQVITKVTTMERECVDPTCGFLGPQLPILNALEDAATLALVAGLIEAAATRPHEAAQSGVGQVGGLLGTVFGMFEGIAGVRVQ